MEIYHDTKYAPLALYSKINLLVERKRDAEALSESQKFIQKYPDNENLSDIEKIKNSLESKLTVNP
jgi:outer membrane protein assembly factor BamD